MWILAYYRDMDESKKSQITVSADKATGASSTTHGANINAVAFNLDLLIEKHPTKAVMLLKEYTELSGVTAESPASPDEDTGMAADQVSDLLKKL